MSFINNKLLQEMAYKAPSTSISVVSQKDVKEIYDHTVNIVLPFIFYFIKSKNEKIIEDNDLVDILYKFKDEFHSEYESSDIHHKINTDSILFPQSKKILKHLYDLGFINSNSIYSFFEYATGDFLFDDPNDQLDEPESDGECFPLSYSESEKQLYCFIVINIEFFLTLDMYNQYLKLGNSSIKQYFENNQRFKTALILTIRHELEHVYQIYNLSLITANNKIVDDLKNGVSITNSLDDLGKNWIDIVDDFIFKNKGYFLQKKSEMDLFKKVIDKLHTTIKLSDEEARLYRYDKSEINNLLNDFIMVYVDIAKNYIDNADDAIEILETLKDYATEFYTYKKSNNADQTDFLKKITSFISYEYPYISRKDSIKFIKDLSEYSEFTKMITVIYELYHLQFDQSAKQELGQKLLKAQKRFIYKLKNNIRKEWINPVLF